MPKTSSSQIYDHIKFCTSTSCLSRKVRQKSRLMNFIYDVLNVALGIRVAHLVDVTFLTHEETLTFISSLRQKIDNNNNHNSDKERHMLLSFSCPVKIFNSLNDSQSNKDIISTVLNDTFTFRIEHNQSFWNKGWELEISDVCLPVVAL
ncbi:hypothetical protein RhiirB3_474628 [Rhizophagus irregularis]|nr:hypothetical protein RhiirB3_474628 [Rhizophagus irregularis]